MSTMLILANVLMVTLGVDVKLNRQNQVRYSPYWTCPGMMFVNFIAPKVALTSWAHENIMQQH